jgi:hypothetical protein
MSSQFRTIALEIAILGWNESKWEKFLTMSRFSEETDAEDEMTSTQTLHKVGSVGYG